MKIGIVFIIIIAILIVGGYFIFSFNQDDDQENSNLTTSNTSLTNVLAENEALVENTNASNAVMREGYTLAEVAEHDISSDCWMVLDNGVYEVTDYISLHPGGNDIAAGCGLDATTYFETRPTGSGTPHSDAARDIRESYYIGDLI